MDIRVEFGRALKAARVAQGLSQEELAFRAGMSVPYLSNLERGRSGPSLVMMHDLAVALGVHLSALVAPMTMATTPAAAGRKRPREDWWQRPASARRGCIRDGGWRWWPDR